MPGLALVHAFVRGHAPPLAQKATARFFAAVMCALCLPQAARLWRAAIRRRAS